MEDGLTLNLENFFSKMHNFRELTRRKLKTEMVRKFSPISIFLTLIMVFIEIFLFYFHNLDSNESKIV